MAAQRATGAAIGPSKPSKHAPAASAAPLGLETTGGTASVDMKAIKSGNACWRPRELQQHFFLCRSGCFCPSGLADKFLRPIVGFLRRSPRPARVHHFERCPLQSGRDWRAVLMSAPLLDTPTASTSPSRTKRRAKRLTDLHRAPRFRLRCQPPHSASPAPLGAQMLCKLRYRSCNYLSPPCFRARCRLPFRRGRWAGSISCACSATAARAQTRPQR